MYRALFSLSFFCRKTEDREKERFFFFQAKKRKKKITTLLEEVGEKSFFPCFSSFFSMPEKLRGRNPWEGRSPCRVEDAEEKEDEKEEERETEEENKSKRKEKRTLVVSLENRLPPSQISLGGREPDADEDEEQDREEKMSMLLNYWESSLSLFGERETTKGKEGNEEEEERLTEAIKILTTWKEVCAKLREKGDLSLVHMKRLRLFLADEENSRRRKSCEGREEKSRYLSDGYSLLSQKKKKEDTTKTKNRVHDESAKTEDEEDVDALDLFDTFHSLLQMRSRVIECSEALHNDIYNDDEEEEASLREEEDEEENRRTRGEEGERDEMGVFSSGGLSDGYCNHEFATLPLSIKKKVVLSAMEKEEGLERALQTGFCKQMKKVTLSFHGEKERSEKKEENKLLEERDKQKGEEEGGSSLSSEKTGNLLISATKDRAIGECEEEDEGKDEEDHIREEKPGVKYGCRDRKLRVLDVMRSVCIGSVENMISIQLHKLYKQATELRYLLEDFFFQRTSLPSLDSSNYRRLTQIQLYCEAEAQCRSFPGLHACKLQHSYTTGKSSKRGNTEKKDAFSSFDINDKKKRKADEEDVVLDTEKDENGETEKSSDLKKRLVKQEREDEEEGRAGKEKKECMIDSEEEALPKEEEEGEMYYLRDRRQRLLGQIALMEISKSCGDILVFGGTFLRFLTSLGCMYTGGCDEGAGLTSDPSASDSTSQEGTKEDENKSNPPNRKPREKGRDFLSLDLSKDLQTKLSKHLEEIPLPDHALQSALRLLSVLKKKTGSR